MDKKRINEQKSNRVGRNSSSNLNESKQKQRGDKRSCPSSYSKGNDEWITTEMRSPSRREK